MRKKKKEIDLEPPKSGKELLQEYTNEMDGLYRWLNETLAAYDNAIFNTPDFSGFDREYAVRFIRTYDIIHEVLTDAQRNMFYLFTASGEKYKDTLELLSGQPKNVATLRVMICKIRKKIKERYYELYGRDLIFLRFSTSRLFTVL